MVSSVEAASTKVPEGYAEALLATKLHEPRPSLGFVPRSRLIEELDAGLTRGFVLVCAPAGFGKSSLLAHWIRQRHPSAVWLSLDAGDNDPVRFWRHVLAALDRACTGIADELLPLLGPPAPTAFEGLVSVLVNTMAAKADPIMLVLDDYHLIDTQSVHASLTFLLDHRPDSLHLVLASRSDPPLPLARMRVRGQMMELRAADLRFTKDEVAALLRAAIGADVLLSDSAIEELAARTEGWAAGLQLAGLSLRGQQDVAGFVSTFSGSHRYVLDYLTQEVLELQPKYVRDFLMETSILEQLSGPLCDSVTGQTGGQMMLESIERANLFLIPLDDVRGWWRYHHLFADLLRVRLQQEHPDRIPELHYRAAKWYAAREDIDPAVRHSVAAGELEWAAWLIERYVDALILRGEQATIQRWIASLPVSLLHARPRLLIAQSIMALVSLEANSVEVPLELAERALTNVADESFEPSVGKSASMVANLPAAIALGHSYLAFLRNDTERAVNFASTAQTLVDKDEWLLSGLIRTHAGLAEWLSGRLPEAEHAFSLNVAQWRAAGHHLSVGWSIHQLAEVQRVQGRLDDAQRTYEELLEYTRSLRRTTDPSAGIAQVGLAELAYERGDVDAARQYLTDGITLCRQLPYSQSLATGLSLLARIRELEMDRDGATEAIQEADRLAPEPGLLNPVPVIRARLLLAHGDVASVRRWTGERNLTTDDDVHYAREAEYLVLVRLALAEDEPERCLALLERLHAQAVTQGRVRSVIELRALQALALTAHRDDTLALTMLREALALAQPHGYMRIFVDEGAPMRRLLESLQQSGVAPDYLSRLLRDFDAQHSGPSFVRTAGVSAVDLPEPLTPRELEVLRLLAAGASNQRIAGELIITLDTVKKHVSRVLQKLDASNRTEAVAHARQQGLTLQE